LAERVSGEPLFFEERSQGERPVDERSDGERPRKERPNGERPVDERSAGERPKEERPNGERPGEKRAPGERLVNEPGRRGVRRPDHGCARVPGDGGRWKNEPWPARTGGGM
jgi:23S rRNA pseudouridine2605 synthase